MKHPVCEDRDRSEHVSPAQSPSFWACSWDKAFTVPAWWSQLNDERLRSFWTISQSVFMCVCVGGRGSFFLTVWTVVMVSFLPPMTMTTLFLSWWSLWDDDSRQPLPLLVLRCFSRLFSHFCSISLLLCFIKMCCMILEKLFCGKSGA